MPRLTPFVVVVVVGRLVDPLVVVAALMWSPTTRRGSPRLTPFVDVANFWVRSPTSRILYLLGNGVVSDHKEGVA